jgi:hypothetical protein
MKPRITTNFTTGEEREGRFSTGLINGILFCIPFWAVILYLIFK